MHVTLQVPLYVCGELAQLAPYLLRSMDSFHMISQISAVKSRIAALGALFVLFSIMNSFNVEVNVTFVGCPVTTDIADCILDLKMYCFHVEAKGMDSAVVT